MALSVNAAGFEGECGRGKRNEERGRGSWWRRRARFETGSRENGNGTQREREETVSDVTARIDADIPENRAVCLLTQCFRNSQVFRAPFYIIVFTIASESLSPFEIRFLEPSSFWCVYFKTVLA